VFSNIIKVQEAQRDDKGFEIYIADFKFESGRASLVRAWNSQGFTPSPESTKCAFREGEVSSNPKKKCFQISVDFFI